MMSSVLLAYTVQRDNTIAAPGRQAALLSHSPALGCRSPSEAPCRSCAEAAVPPPNRQLCPSGDDVKTFEPACQKAVQQYSSTACMNLLLIRVPNSPDLLAVATTWFHSWDRQKAAQFVTWPTSATAGRSCCNSTSFEITSSDVVLSSRYASSSSGRFLAGSALPAAGRMTGS
jgi:hypothetical protein